ncbi:unnamed protein product [Spirodela intermedia]|uniref:Uncharacterized protein n=2 Tax=Spirodela intermedia TaxID=51605 RepID=A0A7I8KN52_SPIIN|nr:unnamed protein product [Spirodela intermedia]CAA6662633.1 unnamed protein product [Spirodela intermedia]CAA7399041.1 unnamed protein product [Spirodela intermedia]
MGDICIKVLVNRLMVNNKYHVSDVNELFD